RHIETKYAAVRLTTDEWHSRLFGDDFVGNMTEPDEAAHNSRHASVESTMWADVILNFGCWVRSQRDEFRSTAKNLGADFRIDFADAPEEELFERPESCGDVILRQGRNSCPRRCRTPAWPTSARRSRC